MSVETNAMTFPAERRAWRACLLAALLGMAATLLPWAYDRITRSSLGTNQDLWITCALFGGAFLLAVGGRERPLPRWGRWAFAALCLLAALVGLLNLPAKWSSYRERAAGGPGVDQWLARSLACQVAQFSVVTAAGVAGVGLALRRRRRA